MVAAARTRAGAIDLRRLCFSHGHTPVLSRDGKGYLPTPSDVVEKSVTDYGSHYEASGAIRHRNWNNGRIDVQPWPYPSATKFIVAAMKQTVVEGGARRRHQYHLGLGHGRSIAKAARTDCGSYQSATRHRRRKRCRTPQIVTPWRCSRLAKMAWTSPSSTSPRNWRKVDLSDLRDRADATDLLSAEFGRWLRLLQSAVPA